MKKNLAEAIGTAVMVFCGTGAIVLDRYTDGMLGGFGISLAFGVSVTGMIYLFGHISGAHINPAVTIALWRLGTFPRKKVVPFIVSQLIGALVASVLLRYLFPGDATLGATLPSGTAMEAFAIEVLLMLLLMLVILVMSHGSHRMKALTGVAVGWTVFLEAYFAGPLTGASMNPARSIAPALVSGVTDSLWVYLTAPVAGAWLAVWLYQRMRRS